MIVEKKIVIIGAGPAGLTTALQLQEAGERDITVIEADSIVGGISRTVNHNGNRIDIGGHRFFSKSDWVMSWWSKLLPVEESADANNPVLRYQGMRRDGLPTGALRAAAAPDQDQVLLLRDRLSRIYYNRQFFAYPLKLNLDSLRKLGAYKSIAFGLSYIRAHLFPIRPERSLEDFLVNRFGARLYRQFFKEYTEKVWGVPCNEISAEWGAQRIKSLSVAKALLHAAKGAVGIGPKTDQTSLIESFLYPKFGPGQMWEAAAARFVANGGTLRTACKVDRVELEEGRVRRVQWKEADGQRGELACTHVVSTMPVKELVAASADAWSAEVNDVAARLAYRDFITVGLLYPDNAVPRRLNDNWIYIQEPGVKVGRVQVFNNWSPHMVSQPGTTWLGLEFFCTDSDPLWATPDDELKALAHREMIQIGLIQAEKPLDSVVIRVAKAYPGYFGDAYRQFDTVRSALDAVPNLFLVGRNGMHRYNNQDHSMLTAREAANQIVSGQVDKSRIWAINVDDAYHEEK